MSYKVPDWSYEEMSNYLEKNGRTKSWSDDNRVRTNSLNREANTGLDTKSAFYYQYGVDYKLRYKVNIK
jgi:hypothetical protein